jgi:hypothetical protein
MSRASRLSFSFLLLFLSAVSLWTQRFLFDGPFPYSLAAFGATVATVALAWTLAIGGPLGTAKRINSRRDISDRRPFGSDAGRRVLRPHGLAYLP